MNFKIDEYGERITSTTDKDFARIISKNGMSRPEESMFDEEILDEFGNVVQVDKPVVPVDELKSVYYFQYRLDRLYYNNEPNFEPKIYIGVCKEGLKMNMDMSRSENVWCINLCTGDKLSDVKWRDYYNIDGGNPKWGYFMEGSLIGVLIDMDRGILNFYKDGFDLGSAFVTTSLKHGVLHPFIQCQCRCEISIFHPIVYPAYRAPIPEAPSEQLLTELHDIPEHPNEVAVTNLDKTLEEINQEEPNQSMRHSQKAPSQALLSVAKGDKASKIASGARAPSEKGSAARIASH